MILDTDLAHLWVAACSLGRDLRTVILVEKGSQDGEHHTLPTIVACLAGVVRIERPGLKPVDLAAGEAALLAPGVRHVHAPLRAGSAQYAQGFMLGRSDIELSMPGRSWLLAIPENPARTLCERACHCSERERASLIRNALAALTDSRACTIAPMLPAVERMWLYLRRERLLPITAADVLRASGLRPTRAHLVFTAYFSETPHRMLIRHRLEYARHLLLTGAAVGTVATACGFRTRAHLTAAFRHEHGLSPRAWLAASIASNDTPLLSKGGS